MRESCTYGTPLWTGFTRWGRCPFFPFSDRNGRHRSRLIVSASRNGAAASHSAFRIAFGNSMARLMPRSVRTSTIYSGCGLKPRLKTADFCSLGRMGDDKATPLEAAGGLISISRGARSRRSGLNPPHGKNRRGLLNSTVAERRVTISNTEVAIIGGGAAARRRALRLPDCGGAAAARRAGLDDRHRYGSSPRGKARGARAGLGGRCSGRILAVAQHGHSGNMSKWVSDVRGDCPNRNAPQHHERCDLCPDLPRCSSSQLCLMEGSVYFESG